jgi:hypothetical protein
LSGVASNSERGFVVLDAILAITLVAAVLAVVINATRTSLHLADRSYWRRASMAEAEYHLEFDRSRLLTRGGQENGVTAAVGAWGVAVRRRSSERPDGLLLCDLKVEIGVQRRSVILETADFCSVATSNE